MLPAPVTQSLRHWNRLPSRYRNIVHFISFSIILGVFVQVVRLGDFNMYSTHHYFDPDLSTVSPSLKGHVVDVIDTSTSTHTNDTLPDLQADLKNDSIEFPSLEEIRDMVAGTQGFLARDFSLGLGWNNVRPPQLF